MTWTSRRNARHSARDIACRSRPSYWTCPDVGAVSPRSRRLSVVFPLPLSPTTAVIDGRSPQMASEKSSSASVDVRSKRPPPKIFVTRRASSSLLITSGSSHVTRGPTGVPYLSEPWLFRAAAIDGVRAPRMEGASGWQIAQQRDQARDSAKRPLLLERGQARDQHLGIGMERLGEDVTDRRDLDEPSGVHHAESVDELGHESHVVPDEDHGGAEVLLHPRQRLHHLLLHHHVERAGGLVRDDHARAQADGDGNARALLHAAGELVGKHVGDLGSEPDRLQQLPHALLHLSP